MAALGHIILQPQLPNASHQPLFGNSIEAVVLKALSIAEVFGSAQKVELILGLFLWVGDDVLPLPLSFPQLLTS